MKCVNCNGAVHNTINSIHCLDCGDEMQNYSRNEIIEAKEFFEAAQVSINLGKTDEALDKLKKCLHIRRTVLYKYNEDITSTLNLMGEIYKIIGLFRYIIYIICVHGLYNRIIMIKFILREMDRWYNMYGKHTCSNQRKIWSL